MNLAMFLARTSEPVTAERCREAVEGYPSGQDRAAFERMFERDKDELRRSGLAIETLVEGDRSTYRLDAEATFAAPVDLVASDLTVLGLAGAALADDPSFPFGADLRLALAKLTLESSGGRVANPGTLADESPRAQGRMAAGLAEAALARKRAAFSYTNAAGDRRRREVDPYGVFSRDGRWYVVARDLGADSERVFALSRIEDLEVNASKPGTPDFERPDDFDVAAWAMLPFQIGAREDAFEAVVRFGAQDAWRAPRLSAGRGVLVTDPDGSVTWTVHARDGAALERWVVENGPGLALAGPDELRARLAASLGDVAASHG
jgi:proteasome accessory factor B